MLRGVSQAGSGTVSVGFEALELSTVLLGFHSYNWHPLGLSEASSEGTCAGMWTHG